MTNTIGITSQFIKLDAFLKFSGEAETGGHAKILIQDGLVKVNDEICEMRGKKLYPGDTVAINGNTYQVIKAGLGDNI